jgi:hypothetical protein
VAGLVAGAAAPMVARLVIRDMTEKQPEQDLSTGFDFVRFKLPDAKKQWREIERMVKKLPGYRELPGASREEEIVDPTFNYQIEY